MSIIDLADQCESEPSDFSLSEKHFWHRSLTEMDLTY